MIFKFSDLSAIKNIQLNGIVNNTKYIEECFTTVNNRIVEHFDANYLFHNSLFFENEKVRVIDYKSIKDKQEEKTKACVAAAELLVKNNKSISITEVVLRYNLQSVLLFRGENQVDLINHIEYLNLADFDDTGCTEDKIIQHSINNNLLKRLNGTEIKSIVMMLSLYHELSLCFNSIYIYFLRPFTDNDLYNGVMMLILKKPLSEVEFNELTLVLSMFLLEIGLNKVEALTQKIVRQDTFNRLFHSQKQYLSALHVVAESLPPKKNKLVHYLADNIRGSLEIISKIMKEELNDVKKEKLFLHITINELVYIFENLIFTNRTIIGRTIKNSTSYRIDGIMKLNSSKDVFIGNFRKTIMPEISIEVEAVKLIIKDAIVNCIENANEDKPIININISTDDDYVHIEIYNNGDANEKDKENLRNPSTSTRMGLRIMYLLCNHYNWTMTADSNGIDKTWYIFKFPKA